MTDAEIPLKPPSAPVLPPVAPAMAVAVVGTCAGIYVASQFLRNSIGVIAPDLATELALTATEIGLMSSLFFLVFAAVQLPLGIAIDRFGPRACILGSVMLAVSGSLLFAAAGSFASLLTARVLMGLGCAALLMAPLAVFARWFPPDRFSSLLGIQIAVGSIGTLLATAPLGRAAEAFGWRSPFVVVAALTALGAVLVALVVRDNPPGHVAAPAKETLADSLLGVLEVIRTPDAGRLFVMHTCGYAMYVSVLGLWGGPYLTHVHGFDITARGDLLLMLALAQILGAFLWGLSDRAFGGYRRPVLLAAVATAGLLLVLAWPGLVAGWGLVAWFAAFGFVAAYQPVLMAHGKSLFPPHLIGRGITLMNLGTMGGAFLWQFVTGLVMDLFVPRAGVYPEVAYCTVFALEAAVVLVLTAVYGGARDPWRSINARD